MCGISCSINISGKDNSAERLQEILQKITHRGHAKNRFEVHIEQKKALGCQRLPFTSGEEKQPVKSESGRFVVLMNGEIYNLHSIAEQQHSDTKLATEEIDKLGITALSNFEGMFAFVILDRELNRLLLARDQMGIKPLYYSITEESIDVCSELKGLAQFSDISSVTEVSPGTYIEVDLNEGRILTERGFVSEPVYSSEPLTFEQYSSMVFSELDKAVCSHSRDRNKYGVYLSGGVDSSAVFALLKKYKKQVIPIVIGNNDSSDRSEAKRICELHGVNEPYKVLCPSENEMFKTVHEVIKSVESFEPNVVRQSCVSMLLAAGANSLGVDAIFCGEGADELFGGYPEMVDREKFLYLRKRFLRDLHRTQLQRVDRTSMKYTTEVRVPFLSTNVINVALDPRANNFHISPEPDNYGFRTKRALRKGLGALLDSKTYSREKVVLSEGAGLKGNDPKYGMFAEIFSSMPDTELKKAQSKYPEWKIKSKEEAFYFNIFASLGYHKLESSKKRVVANRNHTGDGKNTLH